MFQRAASRRGNSYSCQITPEGGDTIPKNTFSNSSIHKNFVHIKKLAKSASCLPSKVFSEKLEETDKRSFHFEGSSGISNTLLSERTQFSYPSEIHMKRETDSCRSGNRKTVEKQAIKLVQPSKDQFLSKLFLVAKKDTWHRPVINFKKLNRHIAY